MAFLDCRFLNGRDRLGSQIQLTAHWVEGWKFKDGKWKFEDEANLRDIEEGFFRCRVHLYTTWGQGASRETIEESLQAASYGYSLDSVDVKVCGRDLVITVPLGLRWKKTDNESKNPMIFRDFEGIDLPVSPLQQAGLQVLITYRNLTKLLRFQRKFVDDGDGFRWNPSGPLSS
jgi:hypothetical protein